MHSYDQPALTSQDFPEICSSCRLDIIYGDDADDDNEEEIANIKALLSMSQAGTVANAFFIFIQFCHQFEEVAIITISVWWKHKEVK